MTTVAERNSKAGDIWRSMPVEIKKPYVDATKERAASTMELEETTDSSKEVSRIFCNMQKSACTI